MWVKMPRWSRKQRAEMEKHLILLQVDHKIMYIRPIILVLRLTMPWLGNTECKAAQRNMMVMSADANIMSNATLASMLWF